VGANENGQQTQKRKVEEVKKDKDGFEKVEKKKGWNVWKKPASKTTGGATPGPSNARISEVLDDDVEEWTPDRFGPNAQKAPREVRLVSGRTTGTRKIPILRASVWLTTT